MGVSGRRVPRRVRSHPVPVALVGECSIPPQMRGTIGEQSPCELEVSFHRLRDRSSVDRYDSLRAIERPKPVPQGLVAPAGVTAPILCIGLLPASLAGYRAPERPR